MWGAVAGVPGVLAYRAVNTLDAMVGHRNARYERFGWFCARLDDVANVPAARVSALMVMAVRPQSARAAWRAWRRDAGGHPSPNAGVVEAAFAGSLGLQLGGANTYGDRVEHRVVMGDGRAPTGGDIVRAARLAKHVGHAAAGILVVVLSRRPDVC